MHHCRRSVLHREDGRRRDGGHREALSLGPGSNLIASAVENSGDQHVLVIPVVDDVILDRE
jgi:hypothetical protein